MSYAYFHRDGKGAWHGYDAKTNAAIEAARPLEATLTLRYPDNPEKYRTFEIRFGAKAVSRRLKSPPSSGIIQVNVADENTRVVERRAVGTGGALPAAAAPVAAAQNRADDAAARHSGSKMDAASLVAALEAAATLANAAAQPFRLLREPPAWALDEAAARAAEDREHWRARCGGAPSSSSSRSRRGPQRAGVESRDLRCKIYAQIHYKGLGGGKHRKASVRASKRGGDCVFLDAVYRTPNLVLGRRRGRRRRAARHKEAFGKKKLIAGLEIPVDILEPNVDTTGWLPMQKGRQDPARLRWLSGFSAPATATAAAAPAVVTGGPVAAPPPPPPPVAVPPPPSGAPVVDASAAAAAADAARDVLRPAAVAADADAARAGEARAAAGLEAAAAAAPRQEARRAAGDAARRGSALSASVPGGIAGGAAALKPVDAPADDAPPARRASALSASVLGASRGAAALKKAPPPPPPATSALAPRPAQRGPRRAQGRRRPRPRAAAAARWRARPHGRHRRAARERRGSIAMTPMDESDSDSDGDWD
ncbi:hypothetical protein JL720_13705 [Aureococcus anophagefferens]|nr:hypothetical protein JL720_13705 [Aureococcus anophagefferens]